MRIAIISDIHANQQALTKALSLIDESDIDEVYCLGDIVGYGGNPNECLEMIQSRASKVVVGNHDVAAVNPGHAEYFTKPGRLAVEWTHSALTKEHLSYLSSLPYAITTAECTLVHASPMDPEDFNYVFTLIDAQNQFPHFATPLCFIGHTHFPAVLGEDLKTISIKRGLQFLINVGSVGQPRDGNPNLSFGILDTTKWTYENVRSPYDVKDAAAEILSRGLPSVLADRLFRGM